MEKGTGPQASSPAEEALRRSEEKFRLLAEQARDVIYRYRFGPTPGFEYMSPSVAEMVGYAPEEFYADPELIFRIVRLEDRPLLEKIMRSCMMPPGPFLLAWVHREGRLIWSEQRITPIYQEGRLVALQGIGRDITQRKSAEEAQERLLGELEAEQRWLRAVIERSPSGLVLIEDAQGERVVANAQAERLFGKRLAPEGGVAQYVGQVCRPDGTPMAREEMPSSRALRGEQIGSEEIRLLRPDGGSTPVITSAARIEGPKGMVAGAIVTFQDISAIKELERSREEWITIVAHDLRQPLNAISGHAGLLARMAEPSSPVKARAEHILSSARRLGRMIADLLDASRLETHRLELRLEAVELWTLLRAVLERTREETAGHPVTLELDAALPPVQADPERLEQILGNLLSNAAKYSDLGSPIELRAARREAEVTISVLTRGEGIPSEEMPKLFTRFHRVPRAKRERTGLGLGLYITKGLVEAHGGRIWAESAPGLTAFRFTLRCIEGERTPRNIGGPEIERPTSAPPRGSR